MTIKKPLNTVVIDTSQDNLIAGDWTEILASVLFAVAYVEVFNGSTTPIAIGTGANGEESALPMTIMPGGTPGIVALPINAGSRLSLNPISDNIAAGFVVINLYGEYVS